jgi:hypothetical protein
MKVPFTIGTVGHFRLAATLEARRGSSTAAVMAMNEKSVFDELCQVVQEAIEIYQKDGKPLPPSTSGRDFANKMQHVS